jgi:hypothetical protein
MARKEKVMHPFITVETDGVHTRAEVILDQRYGDLQRMTGYARRSREDKPNSDVGELLALGRALERLGVKLQKQGWGKVRAYDNDVLQKNRKMLEKELGVGESAEIPHPPRMTPGHIAEVEDHFRRDHPEY